MTKTETEARTNMKKMDEDSRKVHFAENDDIFILVGDGEDGMDSSGLSSSNAAAVATAAACDQGEVEEEASSFSLVDIREGTREAVCKWSQTPYWRLLVGTVDDEGGEAKEVQKYLSSFARLEIEDDSPRGLERQLCRSHHEARKVLAEAATHAVLTNDFRLRLLDKSDEEVWKELRHMYKEQSRGSKAFARRMGRADEIAAQRDTVSEEQALEFVEELEERYKAGGIRVKRHSSDSQNKLGKQKNRASKTESGSSRGARSVESLSGDSEHRGSSHTSDKDKRKTPFRVPSMPMMSGSSGKSKDRASKSKRNDRNDADDLFEDIDKKGKTKRSSRWKSLKKSISKKVNGDRGVRSQ